MKSQTAHNLEINQRMKINVLPVVSRLKLQFFKEHIRTDVECFCLLFFAGWRRQPSRWKKDKEENETGTALRVYLNYLISGWFDLPCGIESNSVKSEFNHCVIFSHRRHANDVRTSKGN